MPSAAKKKKPLRRRRPSPSSQKKQQQQQSQTTKSPVVIDNKRGGRDNDDTDEDAKQVSVWDFVKKRTLLDGFVEQSCIHCDGAFSRVSKQLQATTFAVHLMHCNSCPQEVKQAIFRGSRSREILELGMELGFDDAADRDGGGTPKKSKLAKLDDSKPAATKKALQRTPSSSSSSRKKPPRGQSLVMVDRCDDERAEKITMSIMRFLAGCGVSMLVVESPFFIEMLCELNATYVKHYLVKAAVFTQTWLPKLRESVHRNITSRWASTKRVYSTLGSHAFFQGGHDGGKVHIITQERGKLVMFHEIIEQTEQSLSKESLAQMWMSKMVQAAGHELCVEDLFAAVAADNTGVGPDAAKIVQAKYKKIFFNGCLGRCWDLLMQDIGRIHELMNVVHTAQEISEFVRDHERVRRLYKQLANSEGGTMLLEFPTEQMAARANQMLENLTGKDGVNVQVLNLLVAHAEWENVTDDISPTIVQGFVSQVTDKDYFDKVERTRWLTKPLSIFMEHMIVRPGVRASWVLPAFEALGRDITAWCENALVQHSFGKDTLDAVKAAFDARYFGNNNNNASTTQQVAAGSSIRAPQYVLAMLVDPTMTVEVAGDLPTDWDKDCRSVLERFYSDSRDLLQAEDEVNRLIVQEGTWGNDVSRYQEAIRDDPPEQQQQQQQQQDNNGTAAETASSTTTTAGPPSQHVERIVRRQQKAQTLLSPHSAWVVKYKSQFPKLYEPAMRVLTMATQSGRIDRCCNLGKIVPAATSSTTKKKNQNVTDLVYCYVNLRLLKRMGQGYNDDGDDDDGDNNDYNTTNAALDVNNDLENFLSDSILANTERVDDNETDTDHDVDGKMDESARI